MIAKEGTLVILVAALTAVVLVVVARWLPGGVRPVFWGVGILVVAFSLYFFRDPHREPPAEAAGGHVLLAPADGKVVVVQDAEEPLYLRGPSVQVSIFLSPLDVHVNRSPIGGLVEYVDYVPGDYLVAWHPKASEKNERSQIGVRHMAGHLVLFKQIAGFLARRVVYHLSPGDTVTAGERFGIVKFGSRMDVHAPAGSRIVVREGDRVRAGETILGYLPEVPVAQPASPDSSASTP